MVRRVRVRNEEELGFEPMLGNIEQKQLKLFGHLRRMKDDIHTKVYGK